MDVSSCTVQNSTRLQPHSSKLRAQNAALRHQVADQKHTVQDVLLYQDEKNARKMELGMAQATHLANVAKEEHVEAAAIWSLTTRDWRQGSISLLAYLPGVLAAVPCGRSFRQCQNAMPKQHKKTKKLKNLKDIDIPNRD